MRKQILLVTDSLDHRWVELVRGVASGNEDDLTVIGSEQVEQAAEDDGYDVAIIDSSTVSETIEIVATLHSFSAAKRIIVLTAVPGWREARQVYLAGAGDYLLKSYDKGELRRIIESTVA